jgi:urease subunit alpha
VLWKPEFFGVKPELVIKGGFIAWSQMGDANASIPTPQPVLMRPMFGAFGRATESISLAFVSRASLDAGLASKLRVGKRLTAVSKCRPLSKRDMKLNDALPSITVDPETYVVTADGEVLKSEPASVLPLAQRYFLF